ncbi:hypothetical protein LJC14_01525 [Treponema sp. OttesenSCG-928-L16]|nr:hypothetical protein [Treponema sp. OttesenSCG-928-L16]
MKRILLLVSLISAALISCGQDPIFYEISKEVEPKDPVISGGPSKMVEAGASPYVGRGKVYQYGAGSWKRIASPGGTVQDVAAVGSTLYAMTMSMDGSLSSARVWKYDGSAWEEIENSSEYGQIQTIFGTEDTLFVGARDNNSSSRRYAILYYNGTSLVTLKDFSNTGSEDDGGLLRGAVKSGTNYYLATKNKGIFYGTLAALPSASAFAFISGNLTGMIQVGSKIAAVSTNGDDGNILTFETSAPAGFKQRHFSDIQFTPALAVWINPDLSGDDLLLVGIVDTDGSYTYGYREIKLDAGGILPNADNISLRAPGNGSPTTVSDNSVYKSTIGKKRVNSLYQAPDGTLFASTQQAGLWSYRNNEWNAHDN